MTRRQLLIAAMSLMWVTPLGAAQKEQQKLETVTLIIDGMT